MSSRSCRWYPVKHTINLSAPSMPFKSLRGLYIICNPKKSHKGLTLCTDNSGQAKVMASDDKQRPIIFLVGKVTCP